MDNLDPLRGLMDEAKTDFSAGTYAAVWLEKASGEYLHKYFAPFVPNVEAAKDFHITTTYSKTPVDLPVTKITPFFLKPAYFEYEVFGDTLVMRVKHPQLDQLWRMACDLGATWDHPSYKPHITIATKWERGELPPTPTVMLRCTRYKVEPLQD